MRLLSRPVSLLALGAAALLGACDQPGQTPAATARAISAAAPPAPAGNRFDGRYVGNGTLTMSRSSICGAQTIPRAVTVVNGNATFIVDQTRNVSATGPVQADGSVTMLSQQEATSVTGRFQGGAFRGEMRATACHRTLELRRAAPRPPA